MAKQKKRKNGYYQRSFTFNGKRYFVYGKTMEELNQKETEKRAELQGKKEKRDNPTISEYAEKWFMHRKDTRKSNTIRGQQLVFNVINATQIEVEDRLYCFGDLKVTDIKPEDIFALQTKLREPYTITTKAGKTITKQRTTCCVNDYVNVLRHLLNDARKEHIIVFNPCETINNLKRTEIEAKDSYHRALTEEERKAFFNCERAKKSYYYDVFRIAAQTGMRIGEIGALRYVDIKDRRINVCRTITRSECGGYCIGDSTKTKAGKRSFPFDDEGKIEEIIDHQTKINMAIDGNVFDKDSRIFCAVERGLLTAGVVDREIKRICKEAGIEPFTCHAFRSTFITECLAINMPIIQIMEFVGHDTEKEIYRVYGHTTKKLTDEYRSKLKIVI